MHTHTHTHTHTIPMHVQPVAEDVQGHDKLEEEHVGGIEVTEGGTQAHGGDAINQHVQHGAKLAACNSHGIS